MRSSISLARACASASGTVASSPSVRKTSEAVVASRGTAARAAAARSPRGRSASPPRRRPRRRRAAGACPPPPRPAARGASARRRPPATPRRSPARPRSAARWASSSDELARQLEMERDLRAPVDVRATLTLWISRTRAHLHRRGVGAARGSRRPRRSARRGRRRRSRAARARPRPRPRRPRHDPARPPPPGETADHDVGEVPAGGLAHPQPAQLDRRLDPRDRLARRLLGVGRRPVHQHVDVPPHQPQRGRDRRARRRTALRSSRPPAGRPATPISPTSTASDPARSLAEVERVREQRRAAEPPARSASEISVRETSISDHDADTTNAHQAASTCDVDPPGQPRDRERRPRRSLTSDERARLGQRRQVLGLAVAVLVLLVGRPYRDADREEGQQRGDEVRARVQRLGDEPERCRSRAGGELQREQRARGRRPRRARYAAAGSCRKARAERRGRRAVARRGEAMQEREPR